MRYSRKGRYLQPNDSERQPARHVFVDVESVSRPHFDKPNTRIQSLRLWCCSSIIRHKGHTIRREVSSGTNTDSFWHQIYGMCKPSKPLWIWCHNASVDMTWLDLWGEIDKKAFTYRFGVVESSPFILGLRHCSTNIRVVCSTNWFKCKLSEMGELVGLPKHDYPGEETDDETLRTYCLRDVEILERSVVGLLEFVKENKLGMFRPTLPAQSMAYFRHLKQEPKITLAEDQGIKTLERASYYGGRCECGYVGHVVSLQNDKQDYLDSTGRKGAIAYGESVHYLDFQSHYPAVMRDNLYPHRFTGDFESLSISDLTSLLSYNLACSHVQIRSDHTPYPLRSDGGTVYAVGRFWTAICTPELKLALERNEIEKVGYTQHYDGAKIFERPMNELWNLRCKYKAEGNAIYADIAKRIMNAMYGKWGQKGGGWRDTPNAPAMQQWGTYFEHDPVANRILVRRAIAGNVQTKYEAGECAGSFPAIAAHVTSYGRVKLQSAIELCPPKSVYYWDTDSLHCNENAYNALLSNDMVRPGELGYLRLVRTVDHAEYINAKCYAHDGTFICAGLPSKSQPIGDYKLQGEVWQRIGTILESQPSGDIQTRQIVTELSGKYERRQVKSDGWTFPLWYDQPFPSSSFDSLESASQ